jgi:hypothetical protein
MFFEVVFFATQIVEGAPAMDVRYEAMPPFASHETARAITKRVN